MVRFSTNAEPLPPKPPVAWLMREAARYLRDRGYPDEDIWAKHKDEQPATSFPVMIEDVQWLRQNGYRPYHTFNHVLAIPEYMADLKRAFDMYQGGFSTRGDTEARVKDGSLKPGDEVWMYQGWGATWIAYEHNRRPGWFAAGAELDGYHVHVYYRWHMLDAIIFPSADGPTGSPAWEAIRDGFADAQYVALARRWIEKLERNGQKDAADKACKALARIVGAEDSVVPIQRRRERLLWVEAVPSFDMDTAERARAALLELLAGMTPAVAKLGPSLYYGVEPLALDGKVALAIAPGANAAGAEALKAVLVKRFGIQPVAAQAARVVVDLQVGSVPGAWQATNPHITGIYPGPGEYVVHAPPADKAGSRRILIFGRDEAGLKKGIEMWSCFLRSERRGR
jgi:hypothetical protein